MEVRLLGPVELAVGDRVLEAGAPQQRLLLAILAAEAGRLIASESLIDRLWDEPPANARRTLQVHLSRLRRLMEASEQPPVRVVHRSGGYLLDIDSDRVDAHRFRRLVERARDRACPERERMALLGQAIELWRGRPLSDLSGAWVIRVRMAWEQEYLDAMVAWGRAVLRAGDPAAALPRLTELAGEHPLVEPLAAIVMRMLYAAGRASEALDHYTTLRQRLSEDLGTDPGPELQQLHRQILSADPGLAPATTVADRDVPRQLPAPPQLFTGRATELSDLDRMHDGSTVVITAIDGMAGIGKTALAVQAAHRIAGHYPDGQLFIDLHGYTQGLEPIDPGEALDHTLRALGVAGTQIPAGLDQRAALYRSRVADRKLLIVLDNAATEAQVRPLLPGSPGCLVLVTSRRRLTGLDHTHTLSLDTLPPSDAVTLFSQTAGADRLAGQPPGLLTEVVELCGRLPLAIRIAAARLRSRPSWSLTHLAERLRDQRHRLGELAAGQRSITAALDLSYQQLSDDQRHAYRLFGLHPGLDLDAYAAAALLGSTLVHARRMLDQLLDVHLLQEPVAGTYRFHDLTRVHAAEAAEAAEAGHGTAHPAPAADPRRGALDRLLDYYRFAVSVAVDAGYPYERERRPPPAPVPGPVPELADPAAALDWLDVQLPNLLAAARYAAENGRPAHILHLSTILRRHLTLRGRYHDAEALHRQALVTARATGNQPGELDALIGLGFAEKLQGRYEQATERYQRALRVARVTGDRDGERSALTGLGGIQWRKGQYERAADYFGQALSLARATGDHNGELDALEGLGAVYSMRGQRERAADIYEEALRLAQASGNRAGELGPLIGLGNLSRMRGQCEQASDHFGRALWLARATGDSFGEVIAVNSLGNIHRMQGRYEQATDHYRRALRLARAAGVHAIELGALSGLGQVHRIEGRHELAADHFRRLLDVATEGGDRNYQFEAWQGLGRLRHAAGDPRTAITHHERALALASELGQPDDQARAHDGLGHAYHALNRPELAGGHWRQALDLLSGLGADRADDQETTVAAIRDHLASVEERP